MKRSMCERLLDRATETTGLSDAGDPRAMSACELLLECIRDESGISALGMRLVTAEILQIVCNRLRLVDAWRQAEPRELGGGSPVVIFGFPRSGSTFLQGLLALDERFRTPRVWESFSPLPPPGTDHLSDARRQEEVRKYLAVIDRTSPDVRKLRPLDVFAPEECATVMQHTFASSRFEAMFRIPTYSEWLCRANVIWAYEEYRSILSLWETAPEEPRPWLLKHPWHTFHLQEFVESFGPLRLIQTHRAPESVVKSGAALLLATRAGYGASPDPDALLEETAVTWSYGMDRALDWRDATGHPVVDVSFRELTEDPLGTLESVYVQLDIPWTDMVRSTFSEALTAGFASTMIAHPVERKSPPRAAMERFERYCDRFRSFL